MSGGEPETGNGQRRQRLSRASAGAVGRSLEARDASARQAARSRFPASRSLRASRASGFTLLEMLAVILLIGIAMAAVSISVTRGLASARIQAASSELAAALRATRAQAIVQARDENFDVDTRARTYTYTGGGSSGAHPVALPQGLRLSMTSARDDQPNEHTGRIRFFPDGSSTGGRITLQSGQRQWHVNVSWLTGEVRVVDTVEGR